MSEFNGFVFPLAPEDMARIGQEDPDLRRLIDGPDPDELREYEQDRRIQDLIIPLLDRLPPKEADMIDLYFLRKCRQEDIAYLHGCSQAAVSYRLQRGVQRLQFLVTAPRFTDEQITSLLAPHCDEMDMSILLTYRRTTSQSETAKLLKLTQGRVRHRLYKAIARLERLAAHDPGLAEVTRLFVLLRESHNVLFEVKLPQWAHQGKQKRDDTFR